MSKYWELWDIESADPNLVGYTDDPHEAGKWWVLSTLDPTLELFPDIDCEGDCCPDNECKFGLKGGPSAYSPEE